MSTPPGMPFKPFEPSPYSPKKARLRGVPASNEPALESGRESVDPSMLTAGAAEQDAGANELAARPSPEPSPAPASESEGRPEPARAPDLDRLQPSPRWLERETDGGRLPRAQGLPPILGLRTKGAPREQFINGIRVPPSLARERLKQLPAMREGSDNLRVPLRILVASLVAAPIAYYVSMVKFTSWSSAPPQPSQREELVSLASKVAASAQFPPAQEEVQASEAEDQAAMLAARNGTAAPADAADPPAGPAAGDVPAEPPAAPQPVLSGVQSTALRALDPQEVKRLLQQGQQYMAAGDLASARQVFRRAAEAGNAAAALAMGATFDPTVLAKLGGAGIRADIAKAREWYEKAKTYGSADAARRLELLAKR